MSDKQLIEATAQFWLDNGGDAEGFNYTMFRVLEELREIECAQKELVDESR